MARCMPGSLSGSCRRFWIAVLGSSYAFWFQQFSPCVLRVMSLAEGFVLLRG